MKTLIAVFIASLILSVSASAQMYQQPMLMPGQSEIAGGLGISWLNGTPYYMVGVQPDLSFGKVGVGLDLTLRISTKDGKIRKDDWSNGAYRKMIRYVRWGQKHDPLYAQVGQLPDVTLGHGFIMYDYNNSASFEDRRMGAELDVDFEKYGFEAMYGDFQQAGMVGGRAYVRPLKFTKLAAVPVIGGFEVGATYVTDQNKNSSVTAYDTTSKISTKLGNGTIGEFGFDAGLPLLRIPFMDADLFYDFAKIVNFGNGSSAGIILAFNSLGIAKASVKLEHDWIGNEFIPEYFDQFYELQRFSQTDPNSGKAKLLDSVKTSAGWYGQITVSVLTSFRIVGGYRGIDHDPNGGLLHLETQFPNLMPSIVLSAGYDRRTNNTLKDAFIIGDSRSLLYAFIGYKPYPFMTVGLNYYYTFIPENGKYVIQRRVEPRVMFNFSF